MHTRMDTNAHVRRRLYEAGICGSTNKFNKGNENTNESPFEHLQTHTSIWAHTHSRAPHRHTATHPRAHRLDRWFSKRTKHNKFIKRPTKIFNAHVFNKSSSLYFVFGTLFFFKNQFSWNECFWLTFMFWWNRKPMMMQNVGSLWYLAHRHTSLARSHIKS